jgi:hypothetical protein
MGRDKKLFIFLGTFIALAFLINGVLASYNTTIIVKTLEGYNLTVAVNVLDPSNNMALKVLENYSQGAKEITFVYESDIGGIIGLHSIAWLSGIIQKSKRFANYSVGGTITLDLFDDAPISTRSSITNSSNSSSNSVSQTNNTTITSNVILNNTQTTESKPSFITKIDWKKSLLWVGYVVGGLIILFVIFILIKFLTNFIKNRPVSKDDVVLDKASSAARIERQLRDAENKIKEAQETIDIIKNRKNKVAEAEKRFEEAKKELERVKRY